MKTSWKKLLTVVSTALLCGALLTGCGGSGGSGGSDGSGGGMLGSKSLGPDTPKEVVAQLKLGDKDVPLYEYKGAALPEKLQGFHSNLAVTKNAIYGISFVAASKEFHLQKMNLENGAITSVEDLGNVENEPITSDGTNIYFITKKDDNIGVYDGNAVSNFSNKDAAVIRAIFGEKTAYTSGTFVSNSGIMAGTISKDGTKDMKSVLPKDEFAKLQDAKDASAEKNSFLACADKDGFYITTLATHGGKDNWTEPLHMHAPDGKLVRTFEVNTDIPADAQKRKVAERQSIATKDYVVFFGNGFLRLFNKKDGKYVGDIDLQPSGKSLSPGNVTTDDANRLYFTAFDHIYRIDL